MVKHEDRQIGGRTFTVVQLPARKNLRLLRRLATILAPALGAMGGTKLDLAAVGLALERLTDAELDIVIDQVLGPVTCDGRELVPDFDLVFQGDLKLLFDVLAFALEVQFGDFFGGLVATAKARMTASLSPASSTSATNGPVGA